MPKIVRFKPILFARVGWADFYGCCGNPAENPQGGGEHNKKNRGLEWLNFAETEGKLFGYVAAPLGIGGRRTIRISKLGNVLQEAAHDFVSSILVIFIARNPGGGQFIVGWYNEADIFRHLRRKTGGSEQSRFFNLRCDARDAVLLPLNQRSQGVPKAAKGAPGMPQAAIKYVEEAVTHNTPWMKDCIRFVRSYQGDNLLNCLAAPVANNLTNQLVKSGGFEPDQQKRAVIDAYAMKLVAEQFVKRGFTVKDVHTTESYDLYALKGEEEVFIEVKGTRGDGSSFIITEAEVQLSSLNKNCQLCVVHSIALDECLNTSGGIIAIKSPWRAEEHRLTPISYTCKLLA